MIVKTSNSMEGRQVWFDPGQPIPAERLLAHQDKVQIEFKGQIYILRQTRNDKLILTK